jgi:eukaryotic translation initiation factor 2C
MPRGYIHHYFITIQPDKCPRKVNREIIDIMVRCYGKIFGSLKPVFDGRNNMYTREPLTAIGTDPVELEVTLPGEGKDRVFRVTMKWTAQVRILDPGSNVFHPYPNFFHPRSPIRNTDRYRVEILQN